MPVTYTEKAKQISKDYTALQQATKQLEDAINPTLGPVDAEWDREEDDQGRVLYTLRLTDSTGKVSARYTPDELQDSSHMYVRLHLLWGDLLQERTELQLQQIQQLLQLHFAGSQEE